MNLIIDDREHKLVDIIKQIPFKYDFNVERIHYGDYAIEINDQIKVLIERKTWSDLANTIKDPSRSKNVKDMLLYCKDNGILPMYIIEGKQPSNKTSGVRVSGLVSHLDHSILRGIHVIYTPSIHKTISRIETFMKNYSSSEFYNISGGGEKKYIKQKKKVEESDILKEMYFSVPNISYKTYDALIENGYSILDALIYDISEISYLGSNERHDLKGCNDDENNINSSQIVKMKSKNTIGSIKSKKIRKALKNKKVQVSIIACIPLISKKTAETILSNTTLWDIVNKEGINDGLISMEIGGKKRNNLIKYLNLIHTLV